MSCDWHSAEVVAAKIHRSLSLFYNKVIKPFTYCVTKTLVFASHCPTLSNKKIHLANLVNLIAICRHGEKLFCVGGFTNGKVLARASADGPTFHQMPLKSVK